MPRIAKLPIRTTEGGNHAFDVPPSMSETGARQRMFFGTRGEAENARREILARVRRFGSEGRLMHPALAADALNAVEILKPFGLSLSEVAKRFVEAEKERTASAPIAQVLRENIESKTGKSERYVSDLERISGKFLERIGDRLACDLTVPEIEKAIEADNRTPTRFNTARAYLAPAFALAERRGYLEENPFRIRIPKRGTVRRDIDFLSLAECKAVLASCHDHRDNEELAEPFRLDCRDALPGFVLMLFAGIRPAEIERLSWDDVNIEEALVRVGLTKAKTRSARFIELEPAAVAFLEAVSPSERDGSIVPGQWTKKAKAVRKVAGIHGRADVLRKTFATYHLAGFNDVNRTRAAMGHNTKDVLFDHYRGVVRKRDALAFWSIRPAGTAAMIEEVA